MALRCFHLQKPPIELLDFQRGSGKRVKVDPQARAQIRLILEHADSAARRGFEQRLKSIYADHAAKGLLQSGATVKVALRAMESFASELITSIVDQVSPVSKDVETFAMIHESIANYILFLSDRVKDVASMANGNRTSQGRQNSVLAAAEARFGESRHNLMRQLEIHRFAFTVPSKAAGNSMFAEATQTASATTAIHKNPGGRPAAAFWDDMWAAIASALYDGALVPRSQADIERAMAGWIEANGHSAAESTIRARARRLWDHISASEA
jgi:hypothetical protein